MLHKRDYQRMLKNSLIDIIEECKSCDECEDCMIRKMVKVEGISLDYCPFTRSSPYTFTLVYDEMMDLIERLLYSAIPAELYEKIIEQIDTLTWYDGVLIEPDGENGIYSMMEHKQKGE